jgi:NADP-dependent 3-hydroxy acid dehydrogenase YdfG
MNILAGKVAIITRASKGIGASIAKAFSAEGASVVVNYSSSKEGADRVLGEIADAGGNAIAIQASVSNPEDVKRLFAETKAAFGQLDILVNNAGVFKFEPFECISVAEFNREFSTNVLGPILTIQEAIKQFGFEEGRIINISSLAGSHSLPNGVLYSATKAAVEKLTQGLSGRTWLAEDSSQCHCARLYSERGHSGGGASWRGKRQALYLCYSAWPIRRTWGYCRRGRLSLVRRVLADHRRNDSRRRWRPLKRLFEILGFLESDPMLLVESTFEIIAPKADAFAKDFYRRLFALHPEIEFLFARTELAASKAMQTCCSTAKLQPGTF